MKRTTKETINRQRNLLNGAGIETMQDIVNVSVAELILIVGPNEIDDLLELLLTEFVYGRREVSNSCFSLSEDEGHQYVCDIFDTNGFYENPEWFYEISVKEFLEFEDLMPSNIPFLTDRIKNYVENNIMLIPERYTFCDDGCYLSYQEMEAVH